jgi:hypothetical protein
LAFVDQKTGKPRRPPEVMTKVLEPFFKWSTSISDYCLR